MCHPHVNSHTKQGNIGKIHRWLRLESITQISVGTITSAQVEIGRGSRGRGGGVGSVRGRARSIRGSARSIRGFGCSSGILAISPALSSSISAFLQHSPLGLLNNYRFDIVRDLDIIAKSIVHIVSIQPVRSEGFGRAENHSTILAATISHALVLFTASLAAAISLSITTVGLACLALLFRMIKFDQSIIGDLALVGLLFILHGLSGEHVQCGRSNNGTAIFVEEEDIKSGTVFVRIERHGIGRRKGGRSNEIQGGWSGRFRWHGWLRSRGSRDIGILQHPSHTGIINRWSDAKNR
mmetsp:Transcript_24985/g.44993  ORF Transcript_24985/g.44993 Transcript_24985/m.44993 type:complete len:296 (-) Transcript_24985:268-1155(-)